MPRLLVLLSAVCFGTTGTAQALGPDAAPVTVGAAGIAVGAALLLLVARAAIAGVTGLLIDREPLTGRWTAATALACSGVLLLVLGGGDASVDPLGILLAVLSGGGYATYAVLAKRMLRLGHAPERVLAASFSLGALLLVPVLAVGDTSWLATGDGLAMAAFLGAIPTALAYVLVAHGLRGLTPAETATVAQGVS